MKDLFYSSSISSNGTDIPAVSSDKGTYGSLNRKCIVAGYEMKFLKSTCTYQEDSMTKLNGEKEY